MSNQLSINPDERNRKRALIESDNQTTTTICTAVAIDHANLFYRVCSFCEKTLYEDTNSCKYCEFSKPNRCNPAASKRLFRVLMSIATDREVFVVIMFDRVARVLFGCTANEFFNFAKTHPYAALAANRALEGEMLNVVLSKPKNGNAQHLRVVSVSPLRTGFRTVIETLKELYK